jgi:hypothetical protein
MKSPENRFWPMARLRSYLANHEQDPSFFSPRANSSRCRRGRPPARTRVGERRSACRGEPREGEARKSQPSGLLSPTRARGSSANAPGSQADWQARRRTADTPLCVALARCARGEASERCRGHERVELTAHAQSASTTCRSTLCGKAAKRARGSFRAGASSQPGTSATSLVADPLRAGSQIGVLDAQNLRQGA